MVWSPDPLKRTLHLIVFFFSAPWGIAEVILSDSFDYTNGPLVTVSDGKWVTHSGITGQIDVVSARVFGLALGIFTDWPEANVIASVVIGSRVPG